VTAGRWRTGGQRSQRHAPLRLIRFCDVVEPYSSSGPARAHGCKDEAHAEALTSHRKAARDSVRTCCCGGAAQDARQRTANKFAIVAAVELCKSKHECHIFFALIWCVMMMQVKTVNRMDQYVARFPPEGAPLGRSTPAREPLSWGEHPALTRQRRGRPKDGVFLRGRPPAVRVAVEPPGHWRARLSRRPRT
jgi:hypothetical protein